MNYDEQFREWQDWPECKASVSEFSEDLEIVHFYREKNSHKGIGEFKSIKKLYAKQVNQDFLQEISTLNNLEHLEIEFLTSPIIEPLAQLENLRYLKLSGVSKITHFEAISKIVSLEKLFIENAKYLTDLAFLNSAHRLSCIGVEGGMYTKQKIASLSPLLGLNCLEALFLTSVQLNDKNLDVLSTIPNLAYLKCSRFAPKDSFESLRHLLPNLICNWCDNYEV